MGCAFCLTGAQGLSGSLSSAQIVGQLVAARQLLRREQGEGGEGEGGGGERGRGTEWWRELRYIASNGGREGVRDRLLRGVSPLRLPEKVVEALFPPVVRVGPV